MEKQKPGFGRAFVVSGSCISWLPASGRHYPSFACPTPEFSLERGPLDVQGGAPTGAGDKVECVTKLKKKRPDLSIGPFLF